MNHSEFEAFHAQTAPMLWAYTVRICGNSELAKDVLQESYLRFLQKPPTSNKFAAMKSYLYTIATRINMDRLKSAANQKLGFNSLFIEDSKHVGNVQKDSLLRVDMDFVFHLLKPRERALLWLAYVEEQTHETIAAIFGYKEKSIKVLLFRARRKLAKLLKKYKVDEEHGYEK